MYRNTRFTEHIPNTIKGIKMIKSSYNYLKQLFKLTELDIRDFTRIKSNGMKFHVRVFDAEDIGRLFLMDMKAFCGLMKMETFVFTPVHIDAPILSTDKVMAFGRSTLVLELYDTTITHPDFHELNIVKKKYISLPSYNPGKHTYYSFRLPESDYKRGYRIKKATESMAKEYNQTYFHCLKSCKPIEPTEKKKKNAEFTKSLFQNGGPAVNQFKKMIGEKKTEKFLMEYMFCSK